MDLTAIAERVSQSARSQGILFPESWDDAKTMRIVVAECMHHRNSDGAFEEDGIIEALVEKFGRSESEKKSRPQEMDDAMIVTEAIKEPVGESQTKESIVSDVPVSSAAITETKKTDEKAKADVKEPVGKPEKKEPIVISVQTSSTAIPETNKTDLKSVALKLTAVAKANGIRFPKTWDETQLRQCVGTMCMANKSAVGSVDEDSVLQMLEEKYGIEEKEKADAPSKEKKQAKRSKKDSDDAVEEDDDDDKPKKKAAKAPKKSETYAHEDNRLIGDAIKEMAGLYFKNADPRKGGVFSKAAKALRECETAVETQKQAIALPGVGKAIAAYIVEMLETGMIVKLEELRAGTA